MKKYKVLLDDETIGFTDLENADASMGVVFGEIVFVGLHSPYDFLRSYCERNRIEVVDYPDDCVIATRAIPGLVVADVNGKEVRGLATYIEGKDNDLYQITVEGIPYPFYEEEFPHHVQADKDRFNKE